MDIKIRKLPFVVCFVHNLSAFLVDMCSSWIAGLVCSTSGGGALACCLHDSKWSGASERALRALTRTFPHSRQFRIERAVQSEDFTAAHSETARLATIAQPAACAPLKLRSGQPNFSQAFEIGQCACATWQQDQLTSLIGLVLVHNCLIVN